MGSLTLRSLLLKAYVVLVSGIVIAGMFTIAESLQTSDAGESLAPAVDAQALSDDVTSLAGTAPTAVPTYVQDIRSLPVAFSGNGSQATGPFRAQPGLAIFDISREGTGFFQVWLMYDQDRRFDQLADGYGSYHGSMTEELLTGGLYFVEVDAAGDWTINVSWQPAG